jgi:glycosyltransferase involved in cell wall biosynthesis
MKISVLIVAHNEERHIAGCIESLLAQTRKAEEIILISHNSTDATAERARKYPVRVIEHVGPAGPAYARIRGFEEVSGDIVLCIDGDARAAKDWIEVMARTLEKPGMVMAGSWIRMSGTLFAKISSWRWYFFCATRGFEATDWLWGASLALWARDQALIIDAFKEGLALSERLHLPVNPDDYWLALFMSRHGDLEVTNKTWVTAYSKETTLVQGIKRGLRALSARKAAHDLMRQGGIPGVRIP